MFGDRVGLSRAFPHWFVVREGLTLPCGVDCAISSSPWGEEEVMCSVLFGVGCLDSLSLSREEEVRHSIPGGRVCFVHSGPF